MAGPHPVRRLLAAPAALNGKAQCFHLGASVVLFLKLTFSLPVHPHSDVACHIWGVQVEQKDEKDWDSGCPIKHFKFWQPKLGDTGYNGPSRGFPERAKLVV